MLRYDYKKPNPTMYVSKRGKIYTKRTVRKILSSDAKDETLMEYKSFILLSTTIKNIKQAQYLYSSLTLNCADLEIADIKKLFSLWENLNIQTRYYYYNLSNFVSCMPSQIFSKTSIAKWIIKKFDLDFSDNDDLGNIDLWTLLNGLNSTNPKCIAYIFRNNSKSDIMRYYSDLHDHEVKNTEVYHIVRDGIRIEYNDLKYDTSTIINIKDDKEYYRFYHMFKIITSRMIYKNLTKLISYYVFISPR